MKARNLLNSSTVPDAAAREAWQAARFTGENAFIVRRGVRSYDIYPNESAWKAAGEPQCCAEAFPNGVVA